MIYELNASGKYFAFKEQLKHSVVKIVREKYLKTTNFEDRQELQVFVHVYFEFIKLKKNAFIWGLTLPKMNWLI